MMLTEKEQFEVAFAAIFHDIGKFKQRAFEGNEKNLSKEALSMEAQILPITAYGSYGYRHALWTYDFFIQEIFPNLNTVIKNKLNWEYIAREASAHHNPSKDLLSEIIAKADRISAGLDRVYEEKPKDFKEYLNIPLKPIISNISLDENKKEVLSEKSEYKYNLNSLRDVGQDKAMFPIKGSSIEKGSYKLLYDAFIKQLIPSLKEIKNLTNLLFKIKDLLYNFTWCIPSATNDYLNDISLYDHSISTMSLALVLAQADDVENPICICAMGVSGIQSFIFQSKNSSFKNAAKLFRGRSFIVSSISTAYKYMVCKAIGVIPFVDIIDAGGKITLILPNFNGIDAILDEVHKKIEAFLLKEYFGTLSIVADYSLKVDSRYFLVAKKNNSNINFKELQRQIGFKLNRKKNNKFARVLSDVNYVFEDFDLSGQVCVACGKHSCKKENLCELCDKQVLVGKQLPHAKYIVFSDNSNGYELLPNEYVSFLTSEEEPLSTNAYSLIEDNQYPTWWLNDYTPEDKTFEEIAACSVIEERGKEFLAYLKIDVDNLGKIVDKGFKDDSFSLSRYVSLSRNIHYFFNTYLSYLLKTKYPNAYTAISGGDDVFIILPWNQAIPLVSELQEPFSFVNKKANTALDGQAKEFEGKNCVSYFGVCFTPLQLKQFIKDFETFSSFISKDEKDGRPISMGLVYRLYSYVNDYMVVPNLDSPRKTYLYDMARKLGVNSKLKYDLSRNIIKDKKDLSELDKESLKFILDKFNNYKSLEDLKRFRVLLINTLYELRKNNKGDN